MRAEPPVHPLVMLASVLLPVACCVAAEPVIPGIDDQALLRMMPGAAYSLPERIYTEHYRQGIEAEEVPALLPPYADRTRAAKWLTIPEARWPELIADFAPVSTKGTNIPYGGHCPFTGSNYFRGCTMSADEFLATPFQARTVEGDHIVYAREEDMPADYPWRPNVTVRIPHLDGSLREYRFWTPEGTEDAPPTFRSDRRHWLCPAGQVWHCRLGVIMREVIPDLTAVLFHEHDEKAARALAAILDRMAEVYPGLPLYTSSIAHGFARNEDGSDYLTRDDYLAALAAGPFRNWEHKPYWFHSIYDYSYCKLQWGIGGWTDGVLQQLGWLAQAFELTGETDAARAFSQAKYGDAAEWAQRVRRDLIDEAARMALVTPPTLGNTSYGYISGAVSLGIAAQDKRLFSRGLEIIEMYLANNWLDDGMPNDGAFNYAMMTYGIIGYRWMNKRFGGLDLKERYPIVETIERLTYRPVRTLFNIGSKHADQHALFFRQRRPWMGTPDPDNLPYGEHEVSQCFPVYGLTALRAGAPGSRLELILDHQNTPNHVHFSKLNIQLFYEGVEVLPDFGYSVGYIDREKEPWKSLEYPFELMGSPEPKDKWGPWRYGYAIHPEAHCVGMVDYWLQQPVPMEMHALLGGMPPDNPGYWAQFVDASGRWLFDGRPNAVDVFRRQVLVLTLPDGRALAVDVFRMRGGARHDLYWHVPSDPGETTLAEPQPIDAENLQAYLEIKPHHDKLTGDTIQHYGRATSLIEKLNRHTMPAGVWRTGYHIQPSRFLPTANAALEHYGDWPRLLHDVHLRLWGSAGGSPATHEEIISARGPWPGILDEVDPATGKPTKNALVGFRDALHFLIPSRASAEPGLESTFVHVLEPRNPSQKELLDSVTIEERQLAEAGAGVVARLAIKGGRQVIVASTLNGESVRAGNVRLDGRLGVAIPESGCLTLYDGTHLAAGGWEVELEPSWRLKLAGVIGDLTGHPQQSALLVQAERKLPIDGTLVGRMLFVRHRANERYTTGYTIAKVSTYGPGQYRLGLANTPPFIQHRMRISKVSAENRRVVYPDFRMYKGAGERNYVDRRARFLRTGFEAPIAMASWQELTLQTPVPETVEPGDAFIVYTIQPGDEVFIPSHFACRRTDTADGARLDIVSTGAATLRTADGREFSLEASDLPDGRALIR